MKYSLLILFFCSILMGCGTNGSERILYDLSAQHQDSQPESDSGIEIGNPGFQDESGIEMGNPGFRDNSGIEIGNPDFQGGEVDHPVNMEDESPSEEKEEPVEKDEAPIIPQIREPGVIERPSNGINNGNPVPEKNTLDTSGEANFSLGSTAPSADDLMAFIRHEGPKASSHEEALNW